MTDIISPEHRSWNMSRIRSHNTSPERRVRSFLHRAGFRFRLHVKNLPGRPDIVLPKYRTVIFVHGCYWHRHPGCKYTYTPKSRVEFWKNKFKQNIERDKQNKALLRDEGWKVLTIWECETTKDEKLLLVMQSLTSDRDIK
ncbi:MAG: very short patch repair endonuclease [Anaerolineales bacterium]